MKNGSTLEKARYGFARYNDMLAANHVPVNANLWNRLQNYVRSQDATW